MPSSSSAVGSDLLLQLMGGQGPLDRISSLSSSGVPRPETMAESSKLAVIVETVEHVFEKADPSGDDLDTFLVDLFPARRTSVSSESTQLRLNGLSVPGEEPLESPKDAGVHHSIELGPRHLKRLQSNRRLDSRLRRLIFNDSIQDNDRLASLEVEVRPRIPRFTATCSCVAQLAQGEAEDDTAQRCYHRNDLIHPPTLATGVG